MDVLDSLEKRIDTLSRILGPTVANVNSPLDDSPVTENIVDTLLTTQSVLTAATQGHEQINKTVNRSSELETYLDPNFIEETSLTQSKEVYLNAISHDLLLQFKQLEQVKNLESTLGAEYFRNIPGESVDKLKEYLQHNKEYLQQSELNEEILIVAMQRYGEIQNGLLKSLGEMKARLEAVENRLAQKKKEKFQQPLPLDDDGNK